MRNRVGAVCIDKELLESYSEGIYPKAICRAEFDGI